MNKRKVIAVFTLDELSNALRNTYPDRMIDATIDKYETIYFGVVNDTMVVRAEPK